MKKALVGWCYQRCSTLSRASSTDLNYEVLALVSVAVGSLCTVLRSAGGSIEMNGRRALGGQISVPTQYQRLQTDEGHNNAARPCKSTC
jgi:hypothetical protein